MPNILIHECIQEVSSFNPIASSLEQFQISEGSAFLEKHRALSSEVRGALEIFENAGHSCIGGFSARAMSSGGLLADDDATYIFQHILDSVHEHKDHIDGIYLALHGAMQAPSYDDPEGYLLAAIAEIVGPDMPVVISLDLHGIITQKMCAHIWAVSTLHTYPHVDFVENGERAAALLLQCINSKKRPHIIDIPIPALVRGDELITDSGILGSYYQRCIALTANNEQVLTASLMIGNPFTDVPELGSHVLAVCTEINEDINSYCQAIAADFWQQKHIMQAHLHSMDEAMHLHQQDGGCTILADAADATSSGASGDSNAILRYLVEHKISDKCLLPILDASAAAAAHEAGIGADIQVQLGGSCDQQFEPLSLQVRVSKISDGMIHNESHGGFYDAGPCAVVHYQNICIVIFTKAIHLFDRSLFIDHQINVRDFDLVVVKSPHTQYEFFSAWSQATYVIDVPGATSAKLASLGHQLCQRPMYPLDTITDYHPQVRCFP